MNGLFLATATFSDRAIPEPGTLSIVALAGLLALRRSRQRH